MMTRRLKPVSVRGLALLSAVLSAAAFAETAPRPRLVWPQDGATVSLLTERQRAYLETPTEKRVAGFDDPLERARLATIGWSPAPVTLVWADVDWDAEDAEVEIRRERDGRIVRREDVSVRTRNVLELRNLETGTAYAWRVTVGGASSEWRRFTTEPGVRLLDVDGVPNFRDLGGRVGLGGRRVRQGLLYRCSGANRNATPKHVPGASCVTERGRRTAREVLGLRTELDLRSDGECRGMGSSPFGHSVRWVQHSSGCYQDMGQESNRKAFADCFRTVCDTNSLPVAFHCISGQDRTGTLAFILNALLGVAEPELSLDWEITVFWNPATGWFSRKGRYEAMLKFFNEKFEGADLREKVERYVLSCGVTREEIERFRQMMLEENPSGNGM